MRVRHMRNEADAGGEEIGVFGRAVNGFGKFGVKRAADGRDIDADFFENLALHYPAHAAAAMRSIMIVAFPGYEIERRVGPSLAFDGDERGRNLITQAFKPGARGLLAGVEGEGHASSPGNCSVCRKASANAMPADTEMFKDRNPAAIGM